MCLRIRSGVVTLFVAITIWSALSTGATPAGWPVRITGTEATPGTGTEATPVTGTVACRRAFQAMQLRVRQDIRPESRQDTQRPVMQLPIMQLPAMQLRERCISPALLPDNPGAVHAPALRALHVGKRRPGRGISSCSSTAARRQCMRAVK